MQPVSFHDPETVETACDLLAQHGDNARIIAGGQSLIQMLKQRLVDADHIININNIDALRGIEPEGDTLWIGATETYAAVRASGVVSETVPVLPEMIATIGDEQIRNRGTLVGGIAHADPEGDPPVLATALDATIRLRDADGERTVAGSEFYDGLYETLRNPSEIITRVGFPIADQNTGVAYESFTPRKGDYAVASIAVVVSGNDQEITDATLVAGSIAEKPLELPAVVDTIDGKPPSAETATFAADVAAENVDPYGDEEFGAEYKRSLVERLVRDATLEAFDAATDDDT